MEQAGFRHADKNDINILSLEVLNHLREVIIDFFADLVLKKIVAAVTQDNQGRFVSSDDAGKTGKPFI